MPFAGLQQAIKQNFDAQQSKKSMLVIDSENNKFTPYQSHKRCKKNFNGKAQFPGTNNPIVCRHLTTFFILKLHSEFLSGNTKISYEEINSVKNIANNVNRSVEKIFRDIKNDAKETHVIKNANWGQFIAKQFQEMQNHKVQTKIMLINSTGHAMAAWLRIKRKNDQTYYVVYFYDPNLTTTHTRAKAYDLSSMEQWTLGSFINVNRNDTEKYYYPEKQPISTIFIPESYSFHSQAPMQHQHVPSTSNRKLTSFDVDLDETAIFHLMKLGFSGTLRELIHTIAALPDDEKIAILAAKSSEGILGLYIALQNGDADTIKAYGEALKACCISGQTLLNLLTAQGKNDFPSLYLALKNQHADAIKAYTELLKTSDVSSADLRDFLAAKEKHGIPGLYVALVNGHVDTIKAYGELLKASGLSTSDLLKLLAAKRKNGVSILHSALKNGHADTIKVYCELLKASGISGPALLELIAAKEEHGIPGFLFSLENGHADAIRAYGKMLKDLGMSGSALLNLLVTNNPNINLGLYIALQNGHADAIKAYGELLNEFGITGTTLLNLLAAKRHDGAPGFMISLYNRHTKALKEYAALLTACGVSSASIWIDFLIAKRNDGTLDFDSKWQNQDEEVVQTYTQLLQAFGISGIVLQNLLAEAGVQVLQ